MPSAGVVLCISLIIGATVFASSDAQAQSSWDQVVPRIKQKCAQEYPDDYSMQAFCIKEQHEGWVAVNGADTPNADQPSSDVTKQQSVSPPDQAADEGAETQFVTIVTRFKQAYDGAANDMQKGALRPQRGQALCRIMQSTDIQNWHGTVYLLSSNSDGNGVIEIDLGNGVYVETMNNAFSDASYQTLIPFNTPLFNQVSRLSKGADIVFSGHLFHDSIDCFKEVSLTVDGVMTEPEFVIRLTSVGHQQLAPQVQAPPADTAAFSDGQTSRKNYEQWFSGLLESDYRSGAEFWASHRSDREPPSCRTGSSDFQAGCMEAARRLSPADIRRRVDADFKRGWNSL